MPPSSTGSERAYWSARAGAATFINRRRRTQPVRALFVLFIAATLMAGCLSQAPDALDVVDEPADKVPFVSVRTLVADDDSGPEPSLGVTPEGVFFTNLGTAVFRSTDDGKTWEKVGEPLNAIPNFDPDLAVDADGTVWESHLYVACSAVSSSSDLGETWTENPAGCQTGPGDRQYVIPTEGGEAFLYLHQLPTFYQTVARTTDYGATWIPLGPAETPGHAIFATGSSGWGGGGFWNPVTDSVFFTYSWNDGVTGVPAPGSYPSGPGFSVTRDDLTFSHHTAAVYDGTPLGLALVTGAADRAGNIYLTWGESHDGDVAVYVAGSQDDGRTWTEKQRVDANETGKVFPVVTAGDNGHVAVAYYEAAEKAHPDHVQGEWNVTLAWTDDFFGNATWETARLNNESVKSGPICISGTTCSGNREFADYFDATTTPDGRVAVTYNRLIDDRLRNEFALTSEAILTSDRLAE